MVAASAHDQGRRPWSGQASGWSAAIWQTLRQPSDGPAPPGRPAGSWAEGGGYVGVVEGEPDDLDERRRQGLELQGAVPEPRWRHPASLRPEQPEREDFARKGCVTLDAAGFWGFLVAVGLAAAAAIRRIARGVTDRDR